MASRQVVFIAALVALGAMLHMVEGLVQYPTPVPGAKLGLANAATLIALELGGPLPALIVAIARPVVAGLAGGTLLSLSFVLSVCGAVTSALVMAGLRRVNRPMGRGYGLVGISLAGGVAHNLGQLAAASLFVGPVTALVYAGPLAIAGLVSGYLVGRLSSSVVQRAALTLAWRHEPAGKCSTVTTAF